MTNPKVDQYSDSLAYLIDVDHCIHSDGNGGCNKHFHECPGKVYNDNMDLTCGGVTFESITSYLQNKVAKAFALTRDDIDSKGAGSAEQVISSNSSKRP